MNAVGHEQRDVFSVSRLNAETRATIEGSFPLLWVEGEISNLAAPRSGHLYFSLKDPHAQVRCALFRAKRQLLRFNPADGDQVLARVRVSFYEPRGEFQLIVEHLEPAGSGAAQRAFAALKEKLAREGLFDAARKQALPAFPRRLGIITSPSGAAIRDVLKVLQSRAPYLPVTIYPALVQGGDAPGELLKALETAVKRSECDVLLLTRGGGSAEDLAAFNDEALARAVAAAPLPVVCAVGHEIDFTICDFAADRRAPTPSAAAELISPDTAAILRHVAAQSVRLHRAVQRGIERGRERLQTLNRRLEQAAPHNRLRQQQQTLDGLDLRLTRQMRLSIAAHYQRLQLAGHRLENRNPSRQLQLLQQRLAGLPARLQQAWMRDQRRRQEQLDGKARELNAVSPLATMQRGFSVLRDQQGGVISRVGQTAPGRQLQARLSDGVVAVRVESVTPDD